LLSILHLLSDFEISFVNQFNHSISDLFFKVIKLYFNIIFCQRKWQSRFSYIFPE